MTVFLNPRAIPVPRPPSRTLVWSATGTSVLAATLWTTVLSIMFFVRWGELRMHGDEVRLAYASIALSVAATALWARVRRLRARYQLSIDYVPFKARLEVLEDQLKHLDEGMAILAERTQRLANGLEEVRVEPGEGDETGELIRMPRPRPPRLRGVKSS